MRAVVCEMPQHWLEERGRSEVAQWDEMWKGVLHMAPMPNRMHQDTALDLAFWLKQHWTKPTGWRVNQEVNLTTPEDEADWTNNYRIPDLVLLAPDRFHIDRGEYMAGAPNVVVEVRSPRDETYDKLPFYAALGVPEVWVIDRQTRVPELHVLADGRYSLAAPDADGWLTSAVGVQLRHAAPDRLRVRRSGDESTAADVPDR